MDSSVLSKKELKKLKNKRAKERQKARRKNGIAKLDLPKFNELNFQQNEENIEDEDVLQIFKRYEERFKQPESIENEIEEIHPEEEEEETISNRKAKKYGRPTVTMLKIISRRPELIEPSDTNAPDPFTLVEIKNARNVVPVPAHWNQKRKYLNYKSGSEMSRYRLPPYLERTGISQMRQALLDIDESKSQAAKQRERIRPKTGLFDVDERLLKDAFFAAQTKPVLTRFGEMYFEGREQLANSRSFRPGKLSKKLRDALGIAENAPPPWLFAMQRHGPPPSYTHMKIPGVNSPIPKGAKWGFGNGGWGQVPVCERNGETVPLYGGNPFDAPLDDIDYGSELWGTLNIPDEQCDGVNI